jgi:hypothetical protein
MNIPFETYVQKMPAGKGAIMSRLRVRPFPFTIIAIFGERSRNPDHHFAGICNIISVLPKNNTLLEIGENVVICCRLGISRSNAIALGVLLQYFKIDFDQAVELISSKVPICNILSFHIMALQKLLNINTRIKIPCIQGY